jgi:hypothetical protein
MYSFNGIGTLLYGRRERHDDGSYIATKWFSVFYCPIFPIASYRVHSKKTESSHYIIAWGSNTKMMLEKVPLNYVQVFRIYGIIVGLLLVLIWLTVFSPWA